MKAGTISHDQRFKDLLKARFEDLLRLVIPAIAPHLDASQVEFLEQEVFSDLPEGTQNEADIVAKVPTDDQHVELILVHTEVEGKASSQMGGRLYRYNAQLHLRHGIPVVPIVMFIRGGKADVKVEAYRLTVLGFRIIEFQYVAFGLSRSHAEEYLSRPEPLAWALAALMRSQHLPPEELKLACMRRLAEAKDLSETHRFLLMNCVQTYLILKGNAQRRYEELLSKEENVEVQEIELSWADRLEAKGVEKGVKQGRLETLRGVVITLLEERFGTIPEATRRQLEGISKPEILEQMVRRVISAQSIDEVVTGQ